MADLARQVGGLSNALGGSLEDFACDLVPEILEKHWRLEVASAQPEEIETSRGPHEIDLVIRGTIGRRPDEDIRALFFGYRADRKAREEIVKAGAAMVFTRGAGSLPRDLLLDSWWITA